MPPSARVIWATVGRGQRGLVGQHVAGHRADGAASRSAIASRSSAGHPVDDHGEDVAAQALVRAVGVAGLGAHGLGGLPLAADHRDHGGAELVGQPGVERQLVGELGVGEVGAEDEHDLVVAGDPVEAVDQPGDQFVGALLGLERGGLR